MRKMTHKSMTASLKYAIVSEKKINLVAKMIRGKPVSEVLVLLKFLPKKSAEILLKLVKAASANASNNLKVDASVLKVKSVEIGRGPKIKRVRAVGRSRMHGYIKHRSFVKVVLDTIS